MIQIVVSWENNIWQSIERLFHPVLSGLASKTVSRQWLLYKAHGNIIHTPKDFLDQSDRSSEVECKGYNQHNMTLITLFYK